MHTKLTLTLDSKTIETAKRYAKQHQTSLSKMVEFYFRAIASEPTAETGRIPPITQELSGIAAFKTTKTDKELLQEALKRKFL